MKDLKERLIESINSISNTSIDEAKAEQFIPGDIVKDSSVKSGDLFYDREYLVCMIDKKGNVFIQDYKGEKRPKPSNAVSYYPKKNSKVLVKVNHIELTKSFLSCFDDNSYVASGPSGI